ncbi:MAG: TIGR02147 family protein [Bacteriovorax sp.]
MNKIKATNIPSILDKLNSEFDKRRLANPRYSLRAYANHLGIGASLLSRILNNKVPFTKNMLTRLREPLSLSKAEYERFERELVKERLKPGDHWGIESYLENIELEKFETIQEWYHFAILELTHLSDFSLKPKWISKKLSISEEEAKLAIDRLLKLELLTMDHDGRYKASINFRTLLEKNLVALAMQNRLKQVLHKAADDARDLKKNEFEQCSFSMAIDSELMEEAREKIHKFKKSLAIYLHKNSKSKDRVYEFAVSFFPLSK